MNAYWKSRVIEAYSNLWIGTHPCRPLRRIAELCPPLATAQRGAGGLRLAWGVKGGGEKRGCEKVCRCFTIYQADLMLCVWLDNGDGLFFFWERTVISCSQNVFVLVCGLMYEWNEWNYLKPNAWIRAWVCSYYQHVRWMHKYSFSLHIVRQVVGLTQWAPPVDWICARAHRING